MAPSPLHGLNIVQTDCPPDQYGDNAQDPLLANAHFPDLAAQLDLWSNLTFQTDEPPSARRPSAEDEQTTSVGDDDKEDDAAEVEGPASLEAHVNAVNPTAVSNSSPHGIHQQVPNYDMNAFLAGFNIDPFLLSQVSPPQPPPPQAATIAQLLAAYPFPSAPFLPAHAQIPGIAPAVLSTPGQLQHDLPSPSPSQPTNGPATQQSKRASRTRRVSSPIAMSPGGEESEPAGAQGLSASEDKRRRNTAASARFRLKKKEREAALERRAQELETRVNALERECEGLRRENGWLKGLVVGVTGASQGAQVVPGSNTAGPSQAKRKRGAEESAHGKEETKKAAIAV